MIPGRLAPALPAGAAGPLADVPPPQPEHLTFLLPFALLVLVAAVTGIVLVLRWWRARSGPGGQE